MPGGSRVTGLFQWDRCLYPAGTTSEGSYGGGGASLLAWGEGSLGGRVDYLDAGFG